MGVVLLVGDNEDALQRLSLLAELEEDNLGACLSVLLHNTARLTLWAVVVHARTEHDLLADVGVRELLKLDPLATYLSAIPNLHFKGKGRTETLLRLVERELAIVLRGIVDRVGSSLLLPLLLLTGEPLRELFGLLSLFSLLLELRLGGAGWRALGDGSSGGGGVLGRLRHGE